MLNNQNMFFPFRKCTEEIDALEKYVDSSCFPLLVLEKSIWLRSEGTTMEGRQSCSVLCSAGPNNLTWHLHFRKSFRFPIKTTCYFSVLYLSTPTS